MVAEGLGDGSELSSVHPVDFVVPSGQIKPCHILLHFLIENVGEVHDQIVCFLEFGIEFKDDAGSPLL